MSAGLDKTASKLDKVGKKMSSVGKSMTMNITAPIVGLGAAMFKTFADFEAVMVEIGARTGATAEQMELLSDAAIKAGRDTVFSATEAGEALLELTSSGASATEAMIQLESVLDLAAAGGLELGAAADGATDILKQFNLTAEQTDVVVNNLVKAAGSSSATVDDLIQSFRNAGPVAKAFGLSVQETSAALAVLANAGIKGADAGTQLKSMLLNMSKNTPKAIGAWEELGISMFDASGEMRNIDDIFKDINVAMDDLPMQDQIRLSQALAGSYGIVGFNSLRAANGIGDMVTTMRGASDASTVADARMNTLAGRFDSMMGSIETLGIVLGGLSEGPLTALIEKVTETVNSLTAWAQENPKLAQGILVVVAAIATIGPILIILGSIISAVSTIAGAFTLVSGAVATVTAGFSLFATVSSGLATLSAAIAGITASLGGMAAILTFLTGPIGILIAALVTLGFFLFANKDEWGNWAQNVANSTEKAGQSMANFGTKMNQGLSKAGIPVDKLSKKIEQMLINWAAQFKSLPELIFGIFDVLTLGMLSIGGKIIQGLIKGMIQQGPKLIGALGKIIQQVISSAKKALGIKSPSRIMMGIGENVVAGFNQGIDSMGGLGVNVNGTSLSAGGTTPTMQTSAISGGGMGGGIVIQNLNIPPGTTKEQVDIIARELDKRVKKRR